MWIKYNRILQGNQWIHPDFAIDGRTSEKYLSPNDNTLFLANTTVEDFTGYDGFEITEVTDLENAKRAFAINVIISKQDFVNRLNDEEWGKIAEYETIIDGMSIASDDKKTLKITIKAWLLKMNMLDTINLNDMKVINMGNILVQYGFVSADRMKEILAI